LSITNNINYYQDDKDTVTAVKTIGIIGNSTKENAADCAVELARWLEARDIGVLFEQEIADVTGNPGVERYELAKRSDLLVVFGGDGTLIGAARYAAENEVPIVGINLGGFGFMTVVGLSEMYETMERIISGDYTVSERMMLDARIAGEYYTALNDVVISRGSQSRMIYMETYVDKQYLTTYKADGLIIATPTGSTAYSLSTGGPIVFPEMNSIIITPICPHTLTNRPIMISQDATIDVLLLSVEKKASVTVDGQVLKILRTGETVSVRKSDRSVNLVNSPFHDYLDILRTKLGWGG